MIVVVTGGRDFDDYAVLKARLDVLHIARRITVIRNGGMTGADALSSYWAYERKVDCECFGPKWRTFDYAAGPFRNHHMLTHDDQGNYRLAHLVAPFPGGRGTANCVKKAKSLGIEVADD